MSDLTGRPPCPNPECTESVVIRNGSHRGRARYHCRGCGRYFGATEGTPMYHLHTPPTEVAQALLVVMRRGSLRAAEEITGHAYETIRVWLQRAAVHAEAVTTLLADNLHLTTVEIDEFWSFVRKKTPNEPDAGERWGCLVQDRPSRFIAACATGRISDDLVERAVTLTVTRTRRRPLSWGSDGWRGYRTILRRAYRQPVPTGHRGRPRLRVPPTLRLTQTIKHRDARGRLLCVETRAALGELVVTPGTMQMERLNGTFRDRLNALTRKTHAFAKRDATWDALVHLQMFEHNWLRPHPALRLPVPLAHRRSLRRTPAMALTLADHPWSWTEFLTTPLPCHP